MNKKFLGLAIIMSAFILGFSVNMLAISKPQPQSFRIATVDIQKIALNSEELKNLKIEEEKQLQDLQSAINKAKIEISAEKDPSKIAQLEEKYRNEINEKKLNMDANYNKKLIAINDKIKTAIVEKARSLNYSIVLPKNAVLFGGDDITSQVEGIIK